MSGRTEGGVKIAKSLKTRCLKPNQAHPFLPKSTFGTSILSSGVENCW